MDFAALFRELNLLLTFRKGRFLGVAHLGMAVMAGYTFLIFGTRFFVFGNGSAAGETLVVIGLFQTMGNGNANDERGDGLGKRV